MTVAVIFVSSRTSKDSEDYESMASRMEDLARRQPGYRGIDSVRDAAGEGITVSYWEDEACARAWKQVAEHVDAQLLGRDRWYAGYRVVVAEVVREYRHPEAPSEC